MALIKVGLVLFLSFFFVGMGANAEEEDLIHNVCKKTSHFDMCVSTIESDPRSDFKSNPRGFVRILIDRAYVNATAINNYIVDLGKKYKDHFTKECFSICHDLYDAGLFHLNEALGLIYFKDYMGYRDLDMTLDQFYREPYDCEKSFAQFPAIKLPLTRENNYLLNISDLAIEIVNLIECNHIDACVEATPPMSG